MPSAGRHRDMAQRAKRGAAQHFFREVVSTSEHPSECIIWPFARNGEGRAVFGKPRGTVASALVHRVVCAETRGNPPGSDYEAAHLCGNGHLGCVNPNHLEWKTSKQNKADQLTHGTRNRGERNGLSRLTTEQVVEIRGLRGAMLQRLIAERFGIDQSTVSDIQNYRRWRHV